MKFRLGTNCTAIAKKSDLARVLHRNPLENGYYDYEVAPQRAQHRCSVARSQIHTTLVAIRR